MRFTLALLAIVVMFNIYTAHAFIRPLRSIVSKFQVPSRKVASALNVATSLPTRPKTKPLSSPKELLDSTDVFIFDCDGVIWKGDSIIEKVPQVLDKLRALGKTVFFVTNNSTKSRKGYLKKFTGLGLNVQPEGIVHNITINYTCDEKLDMLRYLVRRVIVLSF